MKNKTCKICKEEINKEENSIILPDDLRERLEEDLNTIFENKIVFAKVFLSFYSAFESNIKKFNSKELEKFLNDFKGIGYLRHLLDEYGNGNVFGDHYFESRIKRYVDNYREKCIEMINLGREVFMEEMV